MNSLATIIREVDFSKLNQEQFSGLLRKLNPELLLIHIALQETGVNPGVIPQIIRTIGNLSLGTGHGRIQIYMQARVITNIKPEENIEMNTDAVVDR